MANYYEIVPYSAGFANRELTYSSDVKLDLGSCVEIELRSKPVMGIVYAKVEKPPFTTKEIIRTIDEPTLPKHLLSLSKWISEYYSTPLSIVLRSIMPRGVGTIRRKLLSSTSSKSNQRSQIAMNSHQQMAVKKIVESTRSVWLHGTTGSGKTRIYVELADMTISKGKDCLILVPEISLTPQLLDQFKTLSSSNNIHIVHSGLTESQRHTLWRKAINSPEPMIIIGARSALFVPLKNIGLIILDEAHDQSYHQDQQPRYSSIRVASYLAKLTNSKLILGSATPPVDEIFLATTKGLTIIRLHEPVFPRSQTSNVINLANKSDFTKNRWLSDQLLDSIENGIKQNKKSLLLLNLRGTRQSIFCGNCGWYAQCPNCQIPLKYHHDYHKYLCHICDFQIKAVVTCPDCKQPELQYKGIGTKQLEVDLKKIFAGVRTVRYDRDSTSKSVSHDDIYQKMVDAKTQVIIGTQLVSKGLDIAELTTIGIVNADTSLQIPDFTSQERTFQMIYQVSGRAGRQGEKSKVFVQSFLPTHPAVQFAVNRDYDSFYRYEIESRKTGQLPPFIFLAKLIGQFSSVAIAEKKSLELAKQLSTDTTLKVLGPAPAFQEYSRGKYRWQIILKSKHRTSLINAVESLPASWSFCLDPDTLL